MPDQKPTLEYETPRPPCKGRAIDIASSIVLAAVAVAMFSLAIIEDSAVYRRRGNVAPVDLISIAVGLCAIWLAWWILKRPKCD